MSIRTALARARRPQPPQSSRVVTFCDTHGHSYRAATDNGLPIWACANCSDTVVRDAS